MSTRNRAAAEESQPHREPSEVARDILSYLAENPQAQDTLEGIVEWWLLDRQLRKARRSVRQALAELVSERVVLELPGPADRSRYRLNPERLEDIRRWLGDPNEL
ncbi:MAG: hypothetical protein AAGD01_18465 [Acidobacteriota bacterium]